VTKELTQVKVQVKMDVSLRAMSKTQSSRNTQHKLRPLRKHRHTGTRSEVFVPAGEVLTEEIKLQMQNS
jgi:hypothetical protein